MRVLAVFDYYHPHVGGAEVVYKHVLEGLVQRGHQVVLLTLSPQGALPKETLGGVEIVRVHSPLGRMLFPFFGLWSSWKLSRETDVVLTSLYSSSVLTFVLKILTGKKVAMIVHEVLGERWSHLGFSWIRTMFLRVAERIALPPLYDGYVAVSQSTATHLMDLIPQEKIHVVHNGVDHVFFSPRERNNVLRTKLGITADQRVYMYAGRPGYVKGIDTLVQAIPVVLKKQPESVFLLMLTKSPMEKYSQVIASLAALEHSDRIKILPSVERSEVPAHFAMADIAVVPSLTEGFGFLAVEFASMGIPVVASEVDSLPEVLSGKVSFAQPGDPMSLVAAMERAAQGEYLLLPKKRFEWEETIVGYERILQKLL